MIAYYNENDPHAAQWLRNLIAGGHIAAGDVDERSIVDVRPDDLRPYRRSQCHFFAGIGGWSLALRLAGWPDDRPVWTGSCPCQPFSGAGKNGGGEDERHLWPHWFRLVRERRPAVLFGEQVAAAVGWGWLDAVLGDLEAEGYATGAAVLGAHSVGAPHIRQRLWFMADAGCRSNEPGSRLGEASDPTRPAEGQARQWQWQWSRTATGAGSTSGLMAHHDAGGCALERSGELLDGERAAQRDDIDGCGATGLMGHADGPGSQIGKCNGRVQRETLGPQAGQAVERGGNTFWSDAQWLPCTDGKARPVEPGTFPLAHGIPGRVGRLRAYGNAIVPQAAAEFIMAAMDAA